MPEVMTALEAQARLDGERGQRTRRHHERQASRRAAPLAERAEQGQAGDDPERGEWLQEPEAPEVVAAPCEWQREPA